MIAGTTNASYDENSKKNGGIGSRKDANKPEKKTGGPSLFKVIVKCFGGQLIRGWACKLIYDLLQFVNPMVLK